MSLPKIILVLFLFSTLCPAHASAQIEITGFSSYNSSGDWVEIKNTSGEKFDISDLKIIDSTQQNAKAVSYEFKKKIILPPTTSCTQSVSNRLNRSGDRIILEREDQQIDCVSYGDGNGYYCGNEPDLPAPTEGQTARKDDGGWVVGELGIIGQACSQYEQVDVEIGLDEEVVVDAQEENVAGVADQRMVTTVLDEKTPIPSLAPATSMPLPSAYAPAPVSTKTASVAGSSDKFEDAQQSAQTQIIPLAMIVGGFGFVVMGIGSFVYNKFISQ